MKRPTAALLLLLVAGCTAVGPDYKQPTAPEATAELFTGDGVEVETLANWWQNFQDPTLNKLIARGLEHAPSVEAAIARLRSARALREKTETDFLPQFTADGSYSWSRSWGAKDSDGWDKNLGASADASWEIDIFGSVRRSVEQSLATEARLAYTLQEVRVSLAAEIAAAYVDVRRYSAQVAIAETNLTLQTKNADLVKLRYENGDTTGYDLATAQAQVARTTASLPQLRQNLTAAQLKLDCLTGQAPYATASLLTETLDTMSLPELSPKLLPNDLLRRRADIRIAEMEIKGQTAAVGIATAELYPRFFLGGSIGLSSPDLSPWSSYTRTVNFGPSVRWNIFAFGAWEKQIDAAKATLDATLADYRTTVLEAYREAETAWNACHRESERSTALRHAEQHCADALRIAQRLYEFGETDVENVLTQQANLLTAQESLITHRANLFQNMITLYRALGGGWTDQVPEEEVSEDAQPVVPGREP